MKRSISTIVPFFNTNRMVEEYTEKCYWPSHQRLMKLAADNLAAAGDLAKWRKRVGEGWGSNPHRVGRGAGRRPVCASGRNSR